jgi:hypothetical protein
MRKRLFILAVVSATALVALAACGGGSSLVGSWDAVSTEFIGEEESYTEYAEEGESRFEFFSGGNGAMIESGRTNGFTWSAEGGRLMITDSWGTNVLAYNISGRTLTITTGDRWGTQIMTFRRAN